LEAAKRERAASPEGKERGRRKKSGDLFRGESGKRGKSGLLRENG